MMTIKATASCALVGISLIATGCSSDTTGGSSGGDGGSSFSPHVPSNHLTAPITCASHGDGGASGFSDQCTQASDCGSGRACMCGEEFPGNAISKTNVCMPAQCLTDADCGPGNYCSPSIVPLCGTGADGLYCHTTKDTCSDSSDCPSVNWGDSCTWVGSSWSCVSAQCAG